ncbi:MAG: hypothetical protein WC303_02340 [Candidatus Paceibacterota bacterium]|jgi:hypothetical protein
MNEVTSKVKIMIIIGVVLLITCSLIVVLLTKQNQESDLVQSASAEDAGIPIISAPVSTGTVVTSTTTATIKPTAKPTTVQTTVMSTPTKPPRMGTQSTANLYISAEYTESYEEGPLKGYAHYIDIVNKGSEAFYDDVQLELVTDDWVYESVIRVKIPAHGTARYMFPINQGGCTKTPEKGLIRLK